MGTRHTIAVDFGRRRLRAVQTSTRGRLLSIDCAIVRDIPSDIDASDTERAGGWLREALKDAGFSRGRTTFVVSRDQVALKRLSLPSTDADELPDMTRLAMQRDLPFDPQHAVIDYIPVSKSDDSTTVLAVAASEQAIEQIQAMSKEAGLSVGRIALRGLGSSTLVKYEAENESNDAALVIDIIGEGVEFSVVADGVVRMSRAAELPTTGSENLSPEENIALLADAVVTEVRRTWMSYRMSEDAVDVRRVVIMGDPGVAEFASAPIRKLLKVPVEPMQSHPCVEPAGEDVRDAMPVIWPLAGLLLGDLFEEETIDLANPRRRPNYEAERRRRVLMVGALLVLAVIIGKTLADRSLDDLDTQVNDLKEQVRTAMPRAYQAQRDRFRANHVREWEKVRVEWLDHLVTLHELLPAPETLVLDGWAGSLDFRGIEYTRDSEWLAPFDISMSLDGEANNRQVADAFRESLVNSTIYNATTTGPDREGGKRLPHGFTLRLATDDSDPRPEAAPDETTDDSNANGDESKSGGDSA